LRLFRLFVPLLRFLMLYNSNHLLTFNLFLYRHLRCFNLCLRLLLFHNLTPFSSFSSKL
jgi:hypothetical protein